MNDQIFLHFFSPGVLGVMLVKDSVSNHLLNWLFGEVCDKNLTFQNALYSLFDESFSLEKGSALLSQDPEEFDREWQGHITKKIGKSTPTGGVCSSIRLVGEKISLLQATELTLFADQHNGVSVYHPVGNLDTTFPSEFHLLPISSDVVAHTHELQKLSEYWNKELASRFANNPGIIGGGDQAKAVTEMTQFLLPLATKTYLRCEFSYYKISTLGGIGSIQESIKNILFPLIELYTEAHQLTWVPKLPIGSYKVRDYLDDFLGIDPLEPRPGLYQGVEDQDKQKIIFEGDFDLMVASDLMFTHGSNHTMSYDECLETIEDLSFGEKEELYTLAFGHRKPLDPLPFAGDHGSLMVEFFLDYKTACELSSLQIGKLTFAGMHTVLGYEYPEYYDHPLLKDFCEAYDEALTRSTLLAGDLLSDQSQYLPYLASYGHVVRLVGEWTPKEFVSMVEQAFRTPHSKYLRKTLKSTFGELKKLSPLLCRFVRIP